MAAWVFWAITSALVRAARDTAPSVSELAQRVVEMTTPDHTTEAA